MFGKKKTQEPWRDSVYLCTADTSFQADLLEAKLKSEGIPCQRKHEGARNYMEILMGGQNNVTNPVELYVPEQCLEDAKNIIVPIDLDQCEPIEE
ncbi:hypothetical protein M2140_001230 [Clostridiales Family XIII bacterium PM5-7]